jgi:hypothetical protein
LQSFPCDVAKLAIVAIVVVLAVSGLTLYAMHRSKPSRLKVSASLLKLASFSIEVDSDDHRDAPKELPPGSSPVSGHGHDRDMRSPRHRKAPGALSDGVKG